VFVTLWRQTTSRGYRRRKTSPRRPVPCRETRREAGLFLMPRAESCGSGRKSARRRTLLGLSLAEPIAKTVRRHDVEHLPGGPVAEGKINLLPPVAKRLFESWFHHGSLIEYL